MRGDGFFSFGKIWAPITKIWQNLGAPPHIVFKTHLYVLYGLFRAILEFLYLVFVKICSPRSTDWQNLGTPPVQI